MVKGLTKSQRKYLYSKENVDKLRKMTIGRKPGMLGKKHSKETKEKIRRAKKGCVPVCAHEKTKGFGGKKHTEETRKKLSQKKKINWKNPRYRENQRLKILKGLAKKPNKPEQKLINIIEKYNFPFVYTGDGKVILYGLCPDFVDNDGSKKIIEVFGDYWHNREDISWKQQEFGRKAIFSQLGFDTLVIWDHELRNENDVVEKIQNFIEQNKKIEEMK